MKPSKWKDSKKSLNPVRGTLEIIFLYAAIGMIWIYSSDVILSWFIRDPAVVQGMQTAKGITYVLVTAGLFYLIINRRMTLYFRSIVHLNKAIDDLETTNVHLEEMKNKLTNLAYFDSLTGLLSKNRLNERFLEQMAEHSGDPFGFSLLSIDNLQSVHELKGHDAGDELIRLLAADIVRLSPPPNDIGRLSGGQFVILWNGIGDERIIPSTILEKISSLEKKYFLGNDHFFVDLSVGVSLYPKDGATFETLLKKADIALNVAKEEGKNSIIFFEPAMQVELERQIELGNLMHQAILDREFSVYYQPIYSVERKRFTSYEALIRWKQPDQGFIPPLEFIPIAEKSGMIHDLTWIVFEECFRQKKVWEAAGMLSRISINLSAKVLAEENFIADMQELIDRYGVVPANHFAIEVTESAILEHIDETSTRLAKLKEMGFSLALDDFGTGYSSLQYLMTFPVDVLKIDRVFVRTISSEDSETPFLRNIIHFAHEMGVKVISEGVEEEFQKRRLEEFGTDFIQGFYFAKPMPAAEVEKFLDDQHQE